MGEKVANRFDLKTTVVLGSCFAWFSALSVTVFCILFLKMGAVPKWRVVAAAPVPRKESLALVNQAVAAKPILQYRALATPRPDTRGVEAVAAPIWGEAVMQTDFVEFKWLPVPGAVRYRLHVWQMHGGDETTLLDADIDTGGARVELVHRTLVHWELQALDAEGRPRMSVGPNSVK